MRISSPEDVGNISPTTRKVNHQRGKSKLEERMGESSTLAASPFREAKTIAVQVRPIRLTYRKLKIRGIIAYMRGIITH
jgi:hypothetical protein